jgi:hypothetical protein
VIEAELGWTDVSSNDFTNTSTMSTRNEKTYTVFDALYEDLNEGYIWMDDPGVESRDIVKITNEENGRSIYCEVRQIDSNYQEQYHLKERTRQLDTDDTPVVLSTWYQDLLSVSAGETVGLKVEEAWPIWGDLIASGRDHPELVARIATRLGVLSVLLAIVF